MIRVAEPRDLPRLTDIYNEQILNGTASFDTEPCTEREAWFAAHTGRHRLTVWEEDGVVAGYASLSTYNAKPAYNGSAEFSLYIAPEYRGRGIGRALAEDMLAFARSRDDLFTVISLITADNDVSIRLHRSLGFREVGVLRRVGRKFDRFLDVAIYQIEVEK